VQAFKGYRALTAEAMAAAAPQLIVTTTQGLEAMGGMDAFWKRPELALTPAYGQKALVAWRPATCWALARVCRRQCASCMNRCSGWCKWRCR
jgi:ABC-type hemin transport system substrate-binding protein